MQENTGEEILDRGVHFLSLRTLPVILPFYKSILCILKPERVSSLLDPHQDCRARGSPGFHVSNHTQVVLVPPNSPLHLVEEVAQLHENHQACHWQPDIAKQLGKKTEQGLETSTMGNKKLQQVLKKSRNQPWRISLLLGPFRPTMHIQRYYHSLLLQIQVWQHSIYNEDKLYSVLSSLASPAANENNSVWYYSIKKLIKHLLNR